ncbi:hypothetical protein M2132_002409 [Dysgonomonas sp. PH5-45]|nr:hypothetical protein [Dysgonomonas sp. PH5-45]MDH6356051.1 hypothetical protein [Dysgonomonas sp. PH5-45]MDH6388945.1 hypothetical protein [Dysgonomonas sp. PH5-37]
MAHRIIMNYNKVKSLSVRKSLISPILFTALLSCTFVEAKALGSKLDQQAVELKLECFEMQRQLNEKIEYVSSPNYRWTAFVEWTSELDPYVVGESDYSVQSQIKLINNETGAVKVAVPFQFVGEPKKDMREFQEITWNLESNGFYFITSAWVVAGAIHYYDINSGTTRYLSHGLGIERVISEGEYKGFIEALHTTIEEDKGRVVYKVAISPDGKTTIRLPDKDVDD